MIFSPRAIYRFASLTLTVLMIAACASNDEKEDLEPMALTEINAEVTLDEVWSKNIGDIDMQRYPVFRPAVAGNKLIAANSDGDVFAFERSTGKRLWRIDLDQPLSAGVGVGQGLAVVANYRGRVVALNSEDGTERWSSQLSGEVVSAPAVGSGMVVVQTVDGKLFGLDGTTGEQRWSHETILPLLTLRGTASPVISGGTVFTGLDNGKVIALRASDGLLGWEARVAIPQGNAELERVVDIDGAPIVRGDLVFAASYQGRLAALSREDGRILWAQDASTHHSVAVGAGKVYLSDENGKVRAFDVGNGQILWTNNALLRRELSAPVFFDNRVAVGDLEGYVHILDPTDGRIIGREQVDGAAVRIPMLVDGDLLFVLTDDGELVALQLKPVQ
ncbi:MAG: outer membrane protein assembly factor BamB [Gammaproteobacteria bacterium]|nr:outer membrane protein assembly factor BamB [Gammaproteobacteria bacterium]